MKFKINNIPYRIFEVDSNSEKLKIDTTKCYGTHYAIGEIYIDKSLPKEFKRRTLIHELAHAFAYQNAFNYEATDGKSISEESLCEFVATFAEEIIALANIFTKRVKV